MPRQKSEPKTIKLNDEKMTEVKIIHSPANSANDKPKEPKPIPDQYNDLVPVEGLPKYFGNEDEETKQMRGDY